MIDTPFLNALGITAKQITVKSTASGTPTLFEASGYTNKVEIADFTVDSNSLHTKDKSLGQTNSVFVSKGINGTISDLDSNSKTWAFTAGSKFGVTTNGDLYATSANIKGKITTTDGEIGGFKIGTDSLTAGTGISTIGLSTNSSSYPAF